MLNDDTLDLNDVNELMTAIVFVLLWPLILVWVIYERITTGEW